MVTLKNSYEELLELEERMGEVKSKGAKTYDITALPVRVITKKDLSVAHEANK